MNRKFLDVSRCSHANKRQGNVQKRVLQLDLLLFFRILVKKNIPKYSTKYANTVAKDNFFYLDTSTGTAEPKSAQTLYNQGYGLRKILTDVANENKISIPLNIYGYFAAFKNLHPNIKMSILIRLANDNDIIFRNAGAPDSKVLITKFRLWCPKLIFNGAGMKQYVENYLKPKTWKYLREHQEIYQTAAVSSFFRISIGIQRPRHVFL